MLLLLAVLAPVLPLPFQPGVPDLVAIAQPPFTHSRHWLGTDAQGLDVLTQLVYGARTAVLLTLPAAVLAAALGALAGGAAGFWGNSSRLAGSAVRLPVDTLVLGLATLLDTIPRLVLVVAIAASAGLSGPGLLWLLALSTWPQSARLVRAQMLRVSRLPFVEAARAAGLPTTRIWWRHALPHAIQPLRAAFPLSLAGLLGLESTLSFLGVGLPPNVASWGRLLAGIRNEPGAWWIAVFPILFLMVSVLSLQMLSYKRPSAS
jgi:peptide/nickel transport system permease protein